MGRTRLFQQAGSPLIQGHSRLERPFWRDWLIASTFSSAILYAPGPLWASFSDSSPGPAAAFVVGLSATVAYWLPATLAGAGLGVSTARRFGSRRPWLAGTATAVVVGPLWLAAIARPLAALW